MAFNHRLASCTLTPKHTDIVSFSVPVLCWGLITLHLGWCLLTDSQIPVFVLYFLSVLLLSFCQMLLGSSYPFARKSSMKTHFTPDQGQSPLYDIHYFSQSDPEPLLKTNPQQVSKTRLLLRPGVKFSFPMGIVLAALPVSTSFSGWANVPPRSPSSWEGRSGAETCYQESHCLLPIIIHLTFSPMC